MPLPWIVLLALLWLAVLVNIMLAIGLNQRMGAIEALIGGSVSRDPVEDAVKPGTQMRDLPLALSEGTPNGSTYRVLFLSSSCGPCVALADGLVSAPPSSVPRSLRDDTVIVSDRDGAERFRNLGSVVVDKDKSIMKAFGVTATPFGFGMTSGGLVKTAALLSTVEDVVGLTTQTANWSPISVS